jgi:hypothetical protein
MSIRLAVLAFAFVPAVVGAQSLLLGARVGSSSATQQGAYHTQGYTYGSLSGRTAGLSATVEFGPFIALQVEELYTEKGGRFEYNLYEMRVDYLDFPIMARLSTPSVSGARGYVVGGWAPGVEVQCSGYTSPPSVQSRSRPPAGKVAIDCDSYRHYREDRSLVTGLGALYDRGRTQYSLEIRRMRGSDIGGDYALRNTYTTIMLGASRRLR